MTDATLVQLAAHCPRMNTLVLSHCDQITDEGISRLVGGLCGPQQLQRLAMDNCPLLTDSSLELLGSVCQNLCQVDLYDCQLITRQGIENLKVGYTHITVIAFTMCEYSIGVLFVRVLTVPSIRRYPSIHDMGPDLHDLSQPNSDT